MPTLPLPGPVQRHPYLSASLACHAALLAFVLGSGGAPANRRAPPSPAMLATQKDNLQRTVQDLDRIQRQLDPRAPPARTAGLSRAELEREARRIAAAIDAHQLQARAAELARLLNISQAQALAKLHPEQAAPPAAPLAALEQRARAALAAHLREQARARDGTAVQAGGGNGAMGLGFDPDSPHTYTDPRRFGADLHPPAVAAAGLRLGSGQLLGPGGTYANRVYLNTWYLIGPFDGGGQDSLDLVQPPEHALDLEAAYVGKDERPLRWHYEQFGAYPMVPPDLRENALYYGYTEIWSDRERAAVLWLGADDDAKLWVNDSLVWVSGGGNKPWYRMYYKYYTTLMAQRNLTEERRTVRLRAGRNRLLFKLYNGSGACFLSIILTTPASG